MKPAARYALQLKEVGARLAEDRTQLTAAEGTYQQLVQTRDVAIDETRAKMEKLRWQIGDLKVNRAMADLQNMAATMVGNLGHRVIHWTVLKKWWGKSEKAGGPVWRVQTSPPRTSRQERSSRRHSPHRPWQNFWQTRRRRTTNLWPCLTMTVPPLKFSARRTARADLFIREKNHETHTQNFFRNHRAHSGRRHRHFASNKQGLIDPKFECNRYPGDQIVQVSVPPITERWLEAAAAEFRPKMQRQNLEIVA
jgi:hypothetical protein